MYIVTELIFVCLRLVPDISNSRCEVMKSHLVKDINVHRHKYLIWISGEIYIKKEVKYLLVMNGD